MSGSSTPLAWPRAVKCRLVDHWTAEIVTELGRLGIRTILLKGPVLARWLYSEDPSLRGYVDVDLLVAPDDRLRAEEALRSLGFTTTVPLRPRHAIRRHADEWRRQADGAEVDLHTAIHGTERVPGRALWDAIAPNTEPWLVDGVEVDVPGVVARTLHAVLNLLPDDASSSKAAEDLRRVIERVDRGTWVAAVDLADRLGVRAEMGAKLARIPEGAALAHRLGLPTSDLQHLFPVSNNASVPLLSLWHLRSLPTVRAKVQYGSDVFLPPPAFLRARWGLARRGRVGLAAAYVGWVVHTIARGGWALLRLASLRQRWEAETRATPVPTAEPSGPRGNGQASPPSVRS